MYNAKTLKHKCVQTHSGATITIYPMLVIINHFDTQSFNEHTLNTLRLWECVRNRD